MNQNKDQKLDAEIGTRIADIREFSCVSRRLGSAPKAARHTVRAV